MPGSVLSTVHTLPRLVFNNFMSYSFFHSVIHQLPRASHRVLDIFYPYLADEETEARKLNNLPNDGSEFLILKIQ